MVQSEEYLPVKNSFYLGAYEKVYSDLQTYQQPTTASRIILYKSLIAQSKFDQVIQSIKASDPPALISLSLLAKFHIANVLQKENVVAEMITLVEAGNNKEDHVIQYIASSLFYLNGDYERALRLLIQSPHDMDCVALLIQIYLKLDHADLASHELSKLKKWADDATLAQLIEAWVNLQSGDQVKCRDSAYIFEEFSSSKFATPKLLNGHAASLMKLNRFAEAEPKLNQALEQDPKNGDVLANFVVLYNAIGKTDAAQNALAQLRAIRPSHQFVQELSEKDSLFDQCAQKYVN